MPTNMHLLGSSNNDQRAEYEKFAKWILDIGEGNIAGISKNPNQIG